MKSSGTHKRRRAGFSLVEVSLAILVVGLGLIAVFSLFPTGLEAVRTASNDTANGMFAVRVLNGLHARSKEMTLEEWRGNQFALSGINLDSVRVYDGMAYRLTVTSGGARRKEAMLWVMPWYAPEAPTLTRLQASGSGYYTELYYMVVP